MHTKLSGLALAGLLGMGMAGCFRDAPTPTPEATPPAPRDVAPRFWQDAEVHYRFAGGRSNLTFIARYIAEGMQSRLGPGSVWSIFGGMRLATHVNLLALGEGEVDFAVATPPVSATMASRGRGYFSKAYPGLRAIAVYPQNDWLGCAVLADLGVESFEDVKANQIPLRIATDHPSTGIGFLVGRLLDAYGISEEDLKAWGGGIVVAQGPSSLSVANVLSGEANAICHEGWKGFRALVEKVPVRFLPVSDEVMTHLSEEYGYRENTIPKGTYRPDTPPRDLPVVDFSDWVVLSDARVSEDLAYLAAKVAVEDRADFEILYMGQEPEERSVDLPLQPEIMWKNVGVPLHPGAEKYYREAGLMP